MARCVARAGGEVEVVCGKHRSVFSSVVPGVCPAFPYTF